MIYTINDIPTRPAWQKFLHRFDVGDRRGGRKNISKASAAVWCYCKNKKNKRRNFGGKDSMKNTKRRLAIIFANAARKVVFAHGRTKKAAAQRKFKTIQKTLLTIF